MIDHLVYAVPDLDAGVADLERLVGVRAQAGGKHTGRGTHNALLALGPATYLEVIAPDPDQPEPATPRPFGVDGIGEPHLVGWAITCDDIDAAIARARERGYDAGDAIAMERATPTGDVLRWRLTLNATAGGAVPFLIDWGTTDHPARTAPPGATLESLTIEDPDPDRLAPTLIALDVDIAPTLADQTALVAVMRGPTGALELR